MSIATLILLLVPFDAPTEFSWPIEGSITSGYGPRWGKTHRGIDISAKEGTWVRAAKGGLVVWAGEYGKYGNMVTIRHEDGTKTYYAHLQNFCVFKYQRVKRKQRVGRVGTTGKSTGPHLHFEIHFNKVAQDPLSLLPSRRMVSQPETVVRAVGGP
jgi:murein DD-endopeptidase MepM/ murein hydrolase activator NlpD